MADELFEEVVDVLGLADGHGSSLSVCISTVEFLSVNAAYVIDIYGITVLHLAILHLNRIGIF